MYLSLSDATLKTVAKALSLLAESQFASGRLS
jgi:hypothetical protein